MLYERGSSDDSAKGIVTLQDLVELAQDVCGPHECPLDVDQIRKVFSDVEPTVGDREENLRRLRAAIWAECCGVWQADGKGV